jgi:hypothetical protein
VARWESETTSGPELRATFSAFTRACVRRGWRPSCRRSPPAGPVSWPAAQQGLRGGYRRRAPRMIPDTGPGATSDRRFRMIIMPPGPVAPSGSGAASRSPPTAGPTRRGSTTAGSSLRRRGTAKGAIRPRSPCRRRATKALVIVNDHPALLRARRRRERWSEEDERLYRRHRWRSEGFQGEANDPEPLSNSNFAEGKLYNENKVPSLPTKRTESTGPENSRPQRTDFGSVDP